MELVLDVAHAQVSAYNTKTDFSEYLGKFDLNRIKEFHLNKMKVINETEAIDFHDKPDEKEFKIVKRIIDENPGEYDLVIEYYKDKQGLIEAYKKLDVFLRK